jgi:nucleoside-diphosphate-sugar epimerase
MKNKILITGATGFVGSHLVQALLAKQAKLICPLRSASNIAGCETMVVGDFNQNTDWSACLPDVGAVIHCAARVHVMNDTAADPMAAFRAVNVAGTLRLAEQAAQAGVTQFIFLSSVKVNGESTPIGRPFTESDAPQASDAYGISKLEAEQGLMEIAKRTGMAVTIIRPPLVYGKGVAANFLSMLRWVKKGIPLPLGSIHNQRSFVFVKNLCDFIALCVQNPLAFNQTYLISDGIDLSTTALLQAAAQAMNVRSRLLPFPAGLINLGATLVGKKSIADRLCQSLQVDSSKARQQLGWQAPYSIQDGLREAASGLHPSTLNKE